MTRLLLALMLFIQVVFPGVSLAEKSHAEGIAAQLDKLLYDLEQAESSKGIYAGLSVYNLTNQAYVYQHNPNTPLIPASNMKVWVSTAALDQLGEDYQFKTEVYVKGKISDEGELKGDIIVKAYGDPSFTTEDLQTFVDKLEDMGIRSINGNLVMDETFFDSKRLGSGWMWDDEPYDYSAQISAFALNRNIITYTMTADHPVGQLTTVTMSPKNDYMTVENQVVITDATTRSITADRPLAQNRVIFKGTMGNRATVYSVARTMEEPALFVGNVLKHQLMDKGITFHRNSQVVKGVLDKKSEWVGTHYSAPLAELTSKLNKPSDNLYAEMFLKTLGAEIRKEGSAVAGVKVIADMMKKAGVTVDFHQEDGSGLSRYNWITADHMTKLLSYASTQKYGAALKESFPIAGVDGTLSSRMKNTAAQGKVYAKTGSMNGVNGLSGYVTAANGDQLAFSILLNGIHTSQNARDLQDAVCIALAGEVLPTEPVARNRNSYALSEQLNSLLQNPMVKNVRASLVVKSQDQNRILFEQQADKLMTPVSIVKILTSSAALQKLGEGYRYKTELYITGPVESGTVEGDLILKGYGDPSLNTETLEQLVQALKSRGIKRVSGNVLVDESYFDQQRYPLGWFWDDESEESNPQMSAVGLNGATVRLDYKPGKKEGQAIQVTLLPQTRFVEVVNEAKTVSTREANTLKIERVRGQNVIKISGNLPISAEAATRKVPVHDPALYTGAVLAEKLEANGVKLSSKGLVLKTVTPLDAIKVEEHRSAALGEMVTYLNQAHDNYYAEMITKTLGAELKGAGSTAKGIEVVTDFMKENGLSTTYLLRDGSGHTRYNLLSARQVQGVLDLLASHSSFDSILSVASDVVRVPITEESILASTGVSKGLRSFAGYVMTNQGERLSVSLIMNGLAEEEQVMKELQEAILLTLLTYQPLVEEEVLAEQEPTEESELPPAA
ncbi:D-alanyl-D-alanine carboxypeptidase/D-alanyl-D-alanine-endopeptidase [Ammoniphilus sp. YIM 78166]|uniref:D-alanyl-D-alanine carboxypeptidase/D-alanyl-D-alanine endopeptidase n=1 Tax=Ammoniphilus sp. YIM 78166 TaxID=1644106 RepID=UPI00106FC5B8|nr:D-alanyl-D-alanine carboxypeptidase/D-alanyl-D-alanine-endopeptidase [Ammoniphilus sp. YIM 78166]